MPSVSNWTQKLDDEQNRRFGIAWRNRAQRRTSPVAVLDHRSSGYHFQYLPVAAHTAGFRPFVGFPEITKYYRSSRLWPFFNLRVMDHKRPDFADYLGWLGLGPDASQLDVLSRSGGEQKSDTVSVVEAPQANSTGETEAIFLLRGVRYATERFASTNAAESLAPGTELELVPDAQNESNASALLVSTNEGQRIGWVPELLLAFAHELKANGGTVEIVQNNGRLAPWHARLLIRAVGRTDPGTATFTGRAWPALPASMS